MLLIKQLRKSSEKSVVKAGGGKGSEVRLWRIETFFADNADPRILSASGGVAAQSSFETSPKPVEHNRLKIYC